MDEPWGKNVSERSQIQKPICYVIPLWKMYRIGRSTDRRVSGSLGPRGEGDKE